ncbi:MAG: ATPase [Phycisphaerales bacterium]|nr:ATPase [Hyphomonadaceae bacterium]
MSAEPVRRFYKTAAVAPDGAGIVLDERRLRTPGGAAFAAPTRALAQAMAAEWEAQEASIVPASMPLTQLAFAAIETTPRRRGELLAHVAKYAETDLLCHRAETPQALVNRQAALWDPILEWSREAMGAAPQVVAGIIAAPAAAGVTEALRGRAQSLDDFRLTALAHAVGVSGSAIIGFALMYGAIDAARAFEAAALDELWSLERWGEDAEARTRLDRLNIDFEAIELFFKALQ